MVTRLRAVERLPSCAGLEGLRQTHLLPPPAFPPCSCPGVLSDEGVASDPGISPKFLPLAASIQSSGSRRTDGYFTYPFYKQRRMRHVDVSMLVVREPKPMPLQPGTSGTYSRLVS